MVFDEPTGAHARADLLVRRGEKNDVALERRARALEDDQRHQLRDRLTLHVERATSPHVPVLHHAAERVHLPVLRAGEHDVHVIEKDQRAPGPVSLHPREQVRLAGRGFEYLRFDPLPPQHGPQPVRRLQLVPRRVRRVDGDVLRQQRRRFLSGGPPLGVVLGYAFPEQLGREQHGLRRRAHERRAERSDAAHETERAQPHEDATTHVASGTG